MRRGAAPTRVDVREKKPFSFNSSSFLISSTETAYETDATIFDARVVLLSRDNNVSIARIVDRSYQIYDDTFRTRTLIVLLLHIACFGAISEHSQHINF